ncbi:MAG: signal recognition particle-docking protein FtsY [Chloroflexi bacterium]|nr:signal recognition particle-docking protein FtsY [Chloroflexota bacterium]
MKTKTEGGLRKTRETWFRKLANAFARPDFDDSLWGELEASLLGADVGLDVTEGLLRRVKEATRRQGVGKAAQVRQLLKEEMVALLGASGAASLPLESAGRPPNFPQVLLVVGVNGSGKTTTIAKLARWFQGRGHSVLLAAADTFRAAGIEQLAAWGERLGIEVITPQAGADPGAVTFDALRAAQRRGVEAVIIDTAGRLHTKSNLMEELKKVRRIIDRAVPPTSVHTLLVLDATTGQNGLLQAREFTRASPVTHLVLAKLDGTAKGGIVFAIARELRIPIAYIGIGEEADDLVPFDAREFVDALLTPE